MRHDNIEHARTYPKPFTVQGDMAFIIKSFGWGTQMSRDAFEARLSADHARVCMLNKRICVFTSWTSEVTGDAITYDVTALPIEPLAPGYLVDRTVVEEYPTIDPWVVVGTTTIDGTFAQVYEALAISPWPHMWSYDTEAAVDHFMQSDEPWLIGGRYLRGVGSHLNSHDETAIIRCQVVRRQSDLDAEIRELARQNEQAELVPRPTCGECGPHGNDGRVLLLESWVDCTTCMYVHTMDDVGPVM